jgi:hypothetical protein
MASNEIKLGINLRKNKNSKNAGFGKYYPEVDMQSTLSLKGFAAHLAKHGCIYGLDIIEGVLKKITQCLPELISQGVPVELAPLGRFVPTCSVDKPVLNIPAMEGADPNDVVKGVHIRFYPYGVEDDNITSRRFKQEYCSLEFRNIVDTQEVTLYGKTKNIIKPLKTILAKCKDSETLEVSMKNNCPCSGPLYDCMRIYRGDEFIGCLCINPGEDEPFEIMDADGDSTFFDDKDEATNFFVDIINGVETPEETVNRLCETEKANGET